MRREKKKTWDTPLNTQKTLCGTLHYLQDMLGEKRAGKTRLESWRLKAFFENFFKSNTWDRRRYISTCSGYHAQRGDPSLGLARCARVFFKVGSTRKAHAQLAHDTQVPHTSRETANKPTNVRLNFSWGDFFENVDSARRQGIIRFYSPRVRFFDMAKQMRLLSSAKKSKGVPCLIFRCLQIRDETHSNIGTSFSQTILDAGLNEINYFIGADSCNHDTSQHHIGINWTSPTLLQRANFAMAINSNV